MEPLEKRILDLAESWRIITPGYWKKRMAGLGIQNRTGALSDSQTLTQTGDLDIQFEAEFLLRGMFLNWGAHRGAPVYIGGLLNRTELDPKPWFGRKWGYQKNLLAALIRREIRTETQALLDLTDLKDNPTPDLPL